MFKEMENNEQNSSKHPSDELLDEDDNEIFNLSSSLSNSEYELM